MSIANRSHNVVVVDFRPSEVLVEEGLDGEKAVVGPFGDGMEGHGRVPPRVRAKITSHFCASP